MTTRRHTWPVAGDPLSPPESAGRGSLRVYLGAAPGVGKTVAMLSEGVRRRGRGTDVVVGVVEDHGRAFTAAAAGDLPVIARRAVSHRGIELTEMDTDAVLARAPQVVLVDELAHTNAPGSARAKRWQDVQVLLDAGIDVITTVNVQHLESVNDVVAAITGVAQQETVPDELVRSADAIELVDMSPQALRRRMAHGHIYPAERIDTALANYFREGNLTALRELALLWVADRVDEGLARYRAQHGITATWPARERIVVALTGGPEGVHLIRRAARIAGRAAGRTLTAVHVVRTDGTVGADISLIEQQRLLVEKLGGSLQLVVGDDIAEAVLDFARGLNATQVVIGASRHGPLAGLVRSSTLSAIVRGSGDIDVHVVTLEGQGGRRVRHRRKRRPLVWAAAVLVPAALAAVMYPWRDSLSLSTVLLVFLLGVLANGLIGGILQAAVSAVIAGTLANYLFTPPVNSLTIAAPENVFALVAFIAVGVTVASIVERSRARAAQALRGRAQAHLLASVMTGAVGAADPLDEVLTRARVGLGMSSVALWETGSGGRPGRLIRCSGPAPGDGVEGDAMLPAGEHAVLGLLGHPLPADQRLLVEVLAAQVGLILEREQLTRQAAETARLKQADAVRTAVLAALSHDLRNPLATIKASVSGLQDTTVGLSSADRAELLAAAASAADQLDGLLSNLLDLSRLQTGVLTPVRRPVSVDEVVHRALLGLTGEVVWDDIPDDLPLLDTDAGLLERALANVIANAVRHSPRGQPVRLLAGAVPGPEGERVQIRVVDHGPGVPEADRETMFRPFQRLGDVPGGSGIGLGLAVARGLSEALDATVEVEDTPGGGLTMVFTVPVATADLAESAP